MLQTFVNIRYYKKLQWEAEIKADYSLLFNDAKNELIFWCQHIFTNNSRPFAEQSAQVIAWVDASDVAIGGFCASLLACDLSKEPVTADNWILDGRGALRKLHSGVTLQADVVPWPGSLWIKVRDMADIDPSLVDRT